MERRTHGCQGIRGDCDWIGVDVDSLDQHSRDEYFGESGEEHGTCDFCGRVGGCAIVAVLGSAEYWRGVGRIGVQRIVRRAQDVASVTQEHRQECLCHEWAGGFLVSRRSGCYLGIFAACVRRRLGVLCLSLAITYGESETL
jgi:hypothetical protein